MILCVIARMRLSHNEAQLDVAEATTRLIGMGTA